MKKIENCYCRNALVFIGAWIDSSAHTYLIDDIETFLHHGTVFYIRVMLFSFSCNVRKK